jgi:hypothetical protein
MKRLRSAILAAGALAAAAPQTVNFDDLQPGAPPPGWTATQTGSGHAKWTAKDANNYYIARANALEDNVTIYHTINGRRTEKKRANTKVATNQWHTLRVDFQGTHFTVTFDGKKAIEWDDSTFQNAGKVGVWTKADSVTLFDDFGYGEGR